MNSTDRNLGMDRPIDRRQFVNGVAAAVGASLLPKWSWALELDAQAAAAEQSPDYYPPRLTGMRGRPCRLVRGGARSCATAGASTSSSVAHTGETYDLVVVGGGLSGLAAAHYFVKNVGRSARVLVIDNHDDFGGHAKRNEFVVDGKTIVLNGGTLNIESPLRYNLPSRQLLEEIGVDITRFVKSNESLAGLYNVARSAGRALLRQGDVGPGQAQPCGRPRRPGQRRRGGYPQEYLDLMPLSAKAKADMLRLQDPNQPDYMPGLDSTAKKAQLAKMSLEHYLLEVAKVDKQCLWFFITTGRGNFCVGADAIPALFGWEMGVPGFAGLKLEPTPDGVLADLPGGHHGRQKAAGGGGSIHFPDGNATRGPAAGPLADSRRGAGQDAGGRRRRARQLRAARPRRPDGAHPPEQHGRQRPPRRQPGVGEGGHRHLQPRRQAVRRARPPRRDGVLEHVHSRTSRPRSRRRRKRRCCSASRARSSTRAWRCGSWTAFEKLGISNVATPTMYHDSLGLAEAVDLGDIKHARTPNDPVVLHMGRHPCAPGKPRKEQHRIGRADLLAATFEDFERSIRDQLARVLGGGGFDPGARHRRDHRQPLAARLRLHLQQPDRSDGLGVHVERRSPVREGAAAVRANHDRQLRRGGQPAHRRGVPGGEPRGRRGARAACLSVPDRPATEWRQGQSNRVSAASGSSRRPSASCRWAWARSSRWRRRRWRRSRRTSPRTSTSTTGCSRN